MQKKIKSFRIDKGINSLLVEQCQARNLNQDQVLEMLTIRWLKELKKRPINTDDRYKSVRKKLTGFQMFENAMTDKFAGRFNAFLDTCYDETFMKNYIKMLEFVAPKMQRIDYIVQNHDDNTINIIHSYPSEK